MTLYKLPRRDEVIDKQWVEVAGPDGIESGFQYDMEQNLYYARENQILISSSHGITHISSDLVPVATSDTQGHMSANDKARFDELIQTRIGVLGFQGAGFSDDGGWLSGDIILSAGSEFISLERIGNVIRFTCDNPTQLNCNIEECATLYWIQDESDTSSIRPPSCAGKMPGTNSYGEMKIYLLPETTIFDPTNPTTTFKDKGKYPTLIFKRYDDTITPSAAEFDMVLVRDESYTTKVGWSMTPGPLGVAECVWFMGNDTDGNRIRFELLPESEAGLLGALLYKGHTITRRMGVIVNYTSTVLATNQYRMKYWDIQNAVTIGDEFTATNVWRYQNPENTTTDSVNPKTLSLDITQDVLSIGTLVELWEFTVGEQNSTKIWRRYFRCKPNVNVAHLWSLSGLIRFGDLLVEREEIEPSTGTEDLTGHIIDVADIRLFERSIWGITTFEDRFYTYDGAGNLPSGVALNNQFVADIDYNLPGLKVLFTAADTSSSPELERPVYIWHRNNYKNVYVKMLLGQPEDSKFPPVDVLLRAPVDSYDDVYLRAVEYGQFTSGVHNGQYYILVDGVQWSDLPASGTLRLLSNGRNELWNYTTKVAFYPTSDEYHSVLTLVGLTEFPFANKTMDTAGNWLPDEITICQLLHAEYDTIALRLEFSINSESAAETVQLQFRGGLLDMGEPYELNRPTSRTDDLVRGFRPGYFSTSCIYSQDGFLSGSETVAATPEDFVCYTGGTLSPPIDGLTERWNQLELMLRDNQLWVWWNGLLIPPDPILTANLPTPVVVNTPYFPISIPPDIEIVEAGKTAVRLWPGATLREIEILSQVQAHSEYEYGQLQLES